MKIEVKNMQKQILIFIILLSLLAMPVLGAQSGDDAIN